MMATFTKKLAGHICGQKHFEYENINIYDTFNGK